MDISYSSLHGLSYAFVAANCQPLTGARTMISRRLLLSLMPAVLAGCSPKMRSLPPIAAADLIQITADVGRARISILPTSVVENPHPFETETAEPNGTYKTIGNVRSERAITALLSFINKRTDNWYIPLYVVVASPIIVARIFKQNRPVGMVGSSQNFLSRDNGIMRKAQPSEIHMFHELLGLSVSWAKV